MKLNKKKVVLIYLALMIYPFSYTVLRATGVLLRTDNVINLQYYGHSTRITSKYTTAQKFFKPLGSLEAWFWDETDVAQRLK